ncbi:MAG: RNA polymerase factor sigma-54 [Proteobacteria bacterium]|nr:RNA polymerase factor sigma-54 [Pseudomonadota bacterium]
MALELKQSVKLSQQLVVTPQLQQAIKLLQLSRMELAELIQSEMLENPVLEDGESQPAEAEAEDQSSGEKHEQAKDEDRGHDHSVDEVGEKDGTLKEPTDFDWGNYLETYNAPGYSMERESRDEDAPSFDNVVKQTESLQGHLIWQIHLSNMPEDELKIGTELIGNINDDGYLQSTVEEIAQKTGADPSKVESVLAKVQQLDPLGVGARDLKECLMLQVKLIGDPSGLITRMIDSHLGDLENHNYAGIAKKLGVSVEEVKEASHVISNLEPKPGRPFSGDAPQYITPDVYVQKIGENYVVSLNEDGLPKLRVSDFYRRALMRGSDVGDKTKDYIQGRMRAAAWLIKSIHQRQQTLFKVSSSIVKFQREFFDKGLMNLRPLVLKDVADDIAMHESTISRVTTNKFMHTPRGIFELKFFFNSGVQRLEGGGVASEAVKMMVKRIVDEEDASSPFSDQDIAERLKATNVDIARRTVAKYRESLGIQPSSRRKRKE